MKKWLACTLTVALMVMVFPAVSPLAPAGAQAAEETAFIDALNQMRDEVGLPPLTVHDELTALSRTWAQTMADAGEIFHANPISAGLEAPWLKLGENVGVGPTVDELMNAFAASPGHYANIVDPEFSHVGVGVVWVGNTMYTTHRFMKTESTPPPNPTPTTTEAPASVPPSSNTTPPTDAEPAPAPLAFADPDPQPPVARAERVGVVLRTLLAIDD
ncbi:MAG: CAP domain-containing protein [Acidimicrobiales bacterium]